MDTLIFSDLYGGLRPVIFGCGKIDPCVCKEEIIDCRKMSIDDLVTIGI